MSASSEDIPSLTLRVLERIQGELVALNTKFDTLNEKVETLNTKVDTLNTRVDTTNTELVSLNGRFDNFLTFTGRDVHDLKVRVSALEQRAARRP